MGSKIITYTGKEIDLFNPKVEDICLEDIAHSLSTSNRANGHYRIPFSIAQHSLFVTELARKSNCSEEVLLHCLMHDMAESVLGDCITLVKQHLELFKELEDNMLRTIYEKFNVSIPTENQEWQIKEYDYMAFLIEKELLLNNENTLLKDELYKEYSDWIRYEHWGVVKEGFIETFYDLYHAVNPM